MFGKKKKVAPVPAAPGGDTPPLEPEFAHALDWENSKIAMVEASERKAWKVAGAACVVVILLVVGYIVLLPLKSVDSYVIRDSGKAGTGAPEVLTKLDSENVTFSDTTDKYWLAQYVIARETYDWFTLQKLYDTVGILSSRDVGAAYAALFDGDNALDKVNGTTWHTTVQIESVVPNGKGIGTVRFLTTKKRVDDALGKGEVRAWIATIGYVYRNPSLLTESQRLVNPYGFQVLSYRADSEMVGGAK